MGKKGVKAQIEASSTLWVQSISGLQPPAAGTESSCSQLQAKARFSLAKEESEQIGYLSLHFNVPDVARPLQAALLCETNSQYLNFF